jgi:tRNA threonylcarbamoyladenosine biosynthesis protein TsaE
MGSERLELETSSVEETEALAAELGARLESGAVVALDGELGSGKTAFVRGLARGLGVTETVTSPSFVLMHVYEGRLPLYHFDAWMQGREAAFLEGGGVEWMLGEGVSAVEWAERVRPFLPEPRIEVRITHAGDERRALALALVGRSPSLARALAALRGAARRPEGPE